MVNSDRPECRTLDPGDAAERHECRGHDGASVAGGDAGAGDAALHEPHRHVDRGVALGAHGLRGVLIHADRFGGVDELDAGGQAAALRHLGLDDLPGADEGDLDAELAAGKNRTGHDLGRCAVAPHRIERDEQG